ncbi:hypothetical protein BS35_002591 [Actinomadura glauciflava]|uniref:hypothetical protein n=1 Tax=Actinomadura luteofluorescens TaxID=46163 RepID=UPI0021648034|nr:hypothetical protein [Actinomadura glauciflava]MCR3740036.1 hypothetical protein [Actinomadura glauciflava]
MKRILRTMAVTGITMGAAVLAAPSAMADINFYAVEKAYVGHNGPTYISEKGPGDLIYTDITKSPKAAPVIGNKPVKTGDITTKLHGGKHNTAVTGVEGSEQEATKVALAKAAEHEAAEQQAAPQQAAAPQQESLQAAPEQGAEQAAPQQGEQQAAPEQGAEQAAPQQGEQQAAPEQGAEQAAPQQDAQQAAPEQEAQQAAPEQQQADANAPQAGQRLATMGDHPKPVHIHAVEKSTVGQNGPVANSENGSGDAIFTNLSGSPRSNVYAGNSATMTGPISTKLHGGKHNTVINAVAGPEQESTKK